MVESRTMTREQLEEFLSEKVENDRLFYRRVLGICSEGGGMYTIFYEW